MFVWHFSIQVKGRVGWGTKQFSFGVIFIPPLSFVPALIGGDTHANAIKDMLSWYFQNALELENAMPWKLTEFPTGYHPCPPKRKNSPSASRFSRFAVLRFKFEMLYVVLSPSRRMHARDARVLRYACVYTYVFVCLCFMFTLYDVHWNYGAYNRSDHGVYVMLCRDKVGL